MKLVSWNVNGLRSCLTKGFLDYVRSDDPDVICLQEVLPPAGRYVPEGYKRVGVGVSHPIYVRDSMKASKHSFAIFWEACNVEGIRIINVHSLLLCTKTAVCL